MWNQSRNQSSRLAAVVPIPISLAFRPDSTMYIFDVVVGYGILLFLLKQILIGGQDSGVLSLIVIFFLFF